MFRKLIAVISLVVALMATTVPQANASLSTGACVISLTFNFDGPLGPATAPGFTYSGGGTCAATLSTPPTPTTSIWGSGGSIAWNCGGAVAQGDWNQVFGSDIPSASGSFTLAGANGAYDVTVLAGNLVGTAQMTTIDAVGVGLCGLGGTRRLTLVGVMEFQDP